MWKEDNNGELATIWKEEVMMPCFEVLVWHSPGKTEENHKKIFQDSRITDRDQNRVPPKFKCNELLQYQLARYVKLFVSKLNLLL
jgi:hypothetical protein